MPDEQDQDFLDFIESIATAIILLETFSAGFRTLGGRHFPGFQRFQNEEKRKALLASRVRQRLFVNRADLRVVPRIGGRVGEFFMRRLERALKQSGALNRLRSRVPQRTGELRSSAFIRKEGQSVRLGYQDNKAPHVRFKNARYGQRRVRGVLRQFSRSAQFRAAVARARQETQSAILSGRIR